jgi:aquaporin related protein
MHQLTTIEQQQPPKAIPPANTLPKPRPTSLHNRFPLLHNTLPINLYNHLIAAAAEFLGTTFFLFFALAGTQVAYSTSASSNGSASASALLYTALIFGFSLTVNAWVFFRVTSGLFNPAITLGMCLLGTLKWSRGVVIFVTQVLAGICAAALVEALFPHRLRAETLLGNGTSVVRGFCEWKGVEWSSGRSMLMCEDSH